MGKKVKKQKRKLKANASRRERDHTDEELIRITKAAARVAMREWRSSGLYNLVAQDGILYRVYPKTNRKVKVKELPGKPRKISIKKFTID